LTVGVRCDDRVAEEGGDDHDERRRHGLVPGCVRFG
jgi:hypothetical protein